MHDDAMIPGDVWSRKLDAKDPSASVHTFSRPPIFEALSLLPVAYRVGSYIYGERQNGREPIFDLNGIALEPPNPGPHAGVPCGGLVMMNSAFSHFIAGINYCSHLFLMPSLFLLSTSNLCFKIYLIYRDHLTLNSSS